MKTIASSLRYHSRPVKCRSNTGYTVCTFSMRVMLKSSNFNFVIKVYTLYQIPASMKPQYGHNRL